MSVSGNHGLSLKGIKKAIAVITALCLMIIILIAGILQFDRNLHQIMLQRSMRQVDEISQYVERNFQLQLEQSINVLRLVQGQMKNKTDPVTEEWMQHLKQFSDDSDFKLMGIADVHGKTKDVMGKEYTLQYENLMEQIEKDGIFISNVLYEKDETFIFYALPIMNQGDIVGIVWAVQPLADLVNNIDFTNGYKYFQIIDDQGKYLLTSNSKYALSKSKDTVHKDIWEELRSYKYNKDFSVDKLHQMVLDGKQGSFYFEGNHQGRYVSFRPLQINNWYLFSVQVEDELDNAVQQTQNVTGSFLIIVSCILFSVFTIILVLISFMYKRIVKQNREMNMINSVFKTTLQHTKNIPFVINQDLRQIILYGYPTKDSIKNYSFDLITPENFADRKLIEPENLAEYKNFYESVIVRNEKCGSMVISFNNKDVKQWIRIQVTSVVKDSKNQLIGVIEDYGEQKRKDLQIETQMNDMKKIEKKSQRDYLTGIFNREAFVEKMESKLNEYSENQKGALLLLDLDNFKEVNDRLGHGMGDEVLRTTAVIMKNFFREDDIVGRIGGDEFVIFANNIHSVLLFEKRLAELNEKLCRTFEKEGKSVRVSASIGVVLADHNSRDIHDLYDKADKALYKVKERGRNGHCIYSKMELNKKA